MAAGQGGWITLTEVRDQWSDAPLDNVELAALLDVAHDQCVAFAPVPKTALVPERYRRALVMQARALYRATLVGSGDSIGLDGISVTVFPMDWTVKNLLRPKRGVPNVG